MVYGWQESCVDIPSKDPDEFVIPSICNHSLGSRPSWRSRLLEVCCLSKRFLCTVNDLVETDTKFIHYIHIQPCDFGPLSSFLKPLVRFVLIIVAIVLPVVAIWFQASLICEWSQSLKSQIVPLEPSSGYRSLWHFSIFSISLACSFLPQKSTHSFQIWKTT